MLFNSAGFLFLFLPVALAGFFVLGRRRPVLAQCWLTLASLGFYLAWKPKYSWPLFLSIGMNHWVAVRLVDPARRRRGWLVLGVTANLVLLGWFKYANFFAGNLGALVGQSWSFGEIVLPLGISFFAFQAIAYLVDCWAGRVGQHRFMDFALFKSFFPQLIAGPIVHHSDIMPRFREPETYRFRQGAFVMGLGFLGLGLIKKCVMADGSAGFAEQLFDRPAGLGAPVFLEAWMGTIGYAYQLYFDFSGYSDMAIGLAAMFGLPLPFNFNSPYQASSLVEFWRRWHMTLSRFLREYVYIPLGGNRCSPLRRQLNLAVTMILGGFWHGAKWTFVIWGAWHGFFLLVNHAWRARRGARGTAASGCAPSRLAHGLGVMTTFLVVILGWVWFRAPDVASALSILKALFGFAGSVPVVPVSPTSRSIQAVWLAFCTLVIFGFPNSRVWVGAGIERFRQWAEAQNEGASGRRAPAVLRLAVLGLVLGIGLAFLRHRSAFLYFQF